MSLLETICGTKMAWAFVLMANEIPSTAALRAADLRILEKMCLVCMANDLVNLRFCLSRVASACLGQVAVSRVVGVLPCGCGFLCSGGRKTFLKQQPP